MTAKVLIMKRACVIGGHYHLRKDEHFLLVKGRMVVKVGSLMQELVAPAEFLVLAGQAHSFTVETESVLVCLCTALHDPSDDHPMAGGGD